MYTEDELVATVMSVPVLSVYATDELTKAQADPDTWLADNRVAIQAAMRRPIVRLLLRRHTELHDLVGQEMLGVFGGTNTHVVDMSDEWKARLHNWVQKALPILKLIATFVPPPYNFAIMAITVLLILIDTNRLQPTVVASVFAS